MKERKVDYGTTHEVRVVSATPTIITVVSDDVNEGFLLMGHGLKALPKEQDKGKIIFERDSRKGHWQFYPEQTTTNQ